MKDINELELLKEEQLDSLKMRQKAAAYAKQFLAKKYYEEYKELYTAYLHNRGYNTRATTKMVDERQL